ncbi:hypothetical protein EIP91_002936 [Steccherinum ochraceum]|uniref:F-box domain-containing protein n=1 Tax=Steccherinum ochraceum TaxID=92696 RepID=A0A4R0RMZ9_9APHY|nr:hypothetical protein EIP91_002936 [Steccherinum ochraceum]
MPISDQPYAARLPNELLYHIAEYTRNDRATLKNCSLASRTWHAVARSHLLSSVDVSSYGSTIDLLSFKLAILDDPSRCCYITTICFEAESHATDELFVVLKQLTRLRYLTFHQIRILPTIAHDDGDVKLFTHLEELSFTRCTVLGGSWQPLFDLLNLFPVVKNLKLAECLDDDLSPFDSFWGTQPLACDHQRTIVESSLIYEHLIYDPSDTYYAGVDGAFHESIRQRVDLRDLASMEAVALSPPWNGIQRMICAAHNLKALLLKIHGGASPSAANTIGAPLMAMTLKTCSSIRNVQLNFSLRDPMPPHERTGAVGCCALFTKLASFLNTCPFSSPLLEVRLHINFARWYLGELPEALYWIDWSPLTSAAKVMKCVVVEMHPYEQRGAWDPEAHMPSLEGAERVDHGLSIFY